MFHDIFSKGIKLVPGTLRTAAKLAGFYFNRSVEKATPFKFKGMSP